MEQKEIMNMFDKLYTKMSTSSDPSNMHVFGNTMKSMFKDMMEWRPDVAQEYLDKLEAINWKNYLSKKEAVTIVNGMEPSGGWDVSEWERCMENMDFRTEDSPYYNKWAMYVAMNMIYSDSASTIAKIAGKSLPEMPKEEMFKAIHCLALDKLKDKDGMFNIRAYFHV